MAESTCACGGVILDGVAVCGHGPRPRRVATRRRRDPKRPRTSAEAWKDIQAKIPLLHARILRSIVAAGGLTDDEIEQRTGLSHQNVSARTSEMRTAGVLRDSGVRRFTRNGRKAAVWINAEAPAAIGAQLTMIDDQAERERPKTWHD